jgi:hypothetical protein
MKSTTSFIAAAIAGVFAAGAIVAHAAPLGSTTAAEEKESCKGKEGCKGKEKKEDKKEGTVLLDGADKDKESCKGKDSCKGKEGCKGKEKKEDKKDGTIL